MPTNAINIRRGFKFAALTLPKCRAGPPPAHLIKLSESLAISSSLPPEALSTWEADIGRFRTDELTQTSTFLWAVRESENPEILDRENNALFTEVYQLYLGLLIAVPYVSHSHMTYLGGANADGTARVRTMTTYHPAFYTIGAPQSTLTRNNLSRAAVFAQALARHPRDPQQSRVVRAIRAFRTASESTDLDVRFHQFIRCAECFSALPPGKAKNEFAHRLQQLIHGSCQDSLRELYDIRGGIEHLQGSEDRLRAYPKADRHRILLQRCIQAEGIARFMLDVYLSNDALWPHFVDYTTAVGFWAMPGRARKALWPIKLSFASLLAGFDQDEVTMRLEEQARRDTASLGG